MKQRRGGKNGHAQVSARRPLSGATARGAVRYSTHGIITHFELITARVTDADGAEGMGYTYTVGANGAAAHAIIVRDLMPVMEGQDADLIEKAWQRMWWAQHYGGRGGPASLAISAIDIALWDLKARKLGTPLYRLLGGHEAAVPCYAGGVDLELTPEAALKQTEGNLKKGFRAIKMRSAAPSWPRTSPA